MPEPAPERPGGQTTRPPLGDAYDWFTRGLGLLSSGDAAAAATLLENARDAEPGSAAVLEALSRAHFDAGRVPAAEVGFRELTELAPDSDYARFGLGAALARLGRFEEAEQHLTMAEVMNPHQESYRRLLRQVRATLRARKEADSDGADSDGAR